jgi:DNA-binding response OmpR family regulator
MPAHLGTCVAKPARTTMNPSILLLDGEPMLREVTAMILSRRGGRVTATASVDEALEHAADRIYDIAIIDLSAGAPRGSEILAVMRQRGCLPRRVILCCSDPQGGDQEFTEVIQKPFAFDRLLAVVFGRKGKRRPTRSGVFPTLRTPAPTRRGAPAVAAPRRPDPRPRRAAPGRRGRG